MVDRGRRRRELNFIFFVVFDLVCGCACVGVVGEVRLRCGSAMVMVAEWWSGAVVDFLWDWRELCHRAEFFGGGGGVDPCFFRFLWRGGVCVLVFLSSCVCVCACRKLDAKT